MLRTYFIDGDKGGVGKSTVARAVCDMLIQSERFMRPAIGRLIVVDADPSNQDVCGPGGYSDETIGKTVVQALSRPIRTGEDWKAVIDELAERIDLRGIPGEGEDKTRIVFSLPAGAGLILLENPVVLEMIALFNGVPIWVLGNEEASVTQLQARLNVAPLQYEHGYVIRNLKHGTAQSFAIWNNSETRKAVTDWGWKEIDLPVFMPSVAADICHTPAHRAHVAQTGMNGKKLGVGTMMVLDGWRDSAGYRLSLLEQGNNNE